MEHYDGVLLEEVALFWRCSLVEAPLHGHCFLHFIQYPVQVLHFILLVLRILHGLCDSLALGGGSVQRQTHCIRVCLNSFMPNCLVHEAVHLLGILHSRVDVDQDCNLVTMSHTLHHVEAAVFASTNQSIG